MSILVVVFGVSRAAPIQSPGGVSGIQTQPKQPKHIAEATQAVRRGDQAAAQATLRKAVKDQPELGLAEVLLADIYLSGGLSQQARQLLEEAAVLYPADPEPHLVFADLAWRDRRLTDACVQYQRGRELANEYVGPAERKRKMQVWALAGLGSVAETRLQNKQARALFNELLEIDPEYALAHYRLGNILFSLDQPNEALKELQLASDLSPALPQPVLTLAGLYQLKGDSQQAEQWLQKAVEERPKDLQPLVAMARFQLEVKNDPEIAVDFIANANQLTPTATEPRLLAGLAAWQQGQLPEAEKIFEKLAIEVPNEPNINNYLCCVLSEQGDPDRRSRAEELAQVTASMNNQSSDTLATLGWIAYQQGKNSLAEKQLRAAAQQQPVSRDTKYYLARTLYRKGQLVAAKNLLNEALESDGLFIHLRDAQEWRKQITGKSDAN